MEGNIHIIILCDENINIHTHIKLSMKRRIRKRGRERKREKMTVFQKRQIMNYSQQSAGLCLFITFFFKYLCRNN